MGILEPCLLYPKSFECFAVAGTLKHLPRASLFPLEPSLPNIVIFLLTFCSHCDNNCIGGFRGIRDSHPQLNFFHFDAVFGQNYA